MTTEIKLLAELDEGMEGVIHNIDLDSPTAQRLLDLGFVPGTPIKALRKAPMGDPVTYRIRGYEVGLRKSESSSIAVEVTDND